MTIDNEPWLWLIRQAMSALHRRHNDLPAES